MTADDPTWAAATRQVRAGYTAGVAQNTVTVPIYQSAAYEFENDQMTLVAKFSNTQSVSLFLGTVEFNNDQMTLVTR